MQNQDLIDRINKLLALGKSAIESGSNSGYPDNELFFEFCSSSLALILNLFGQLHPFYTGFENLVQRARVSDTEAGLGILKSVKAEIENGWLLTLKGIVSAEIFSDFIEMASHLQTEGYKDAAAVMIGSVLEEHLRQLALKNGMEVSVEKDGKSIPKKAELINVELCKQQVYKILDQKNITAWLDLRNNAAHGKYEAYTPEQVNLLIQSVSDFIARTTS